MSVPPARFWAEGWRRKRKLALRRALRWRPNIGWVEQFQNDAAFPVFAINTSGPRRRLFWRRAKRWDWKIGWIQKFSIDQFFPKFRAWAQWVHRKRRLVLRRARLWDRGIGWIQRFSVDQFFPGFRSWAQWLHRKRVIVLRRSRRWDRAIGWIQRFSVDQFLPIFRNWADSVHRKRQIRLRRARQYRPFSIGWLQQFIQEAVFPVFAIFSVVRHRRRVRKRPSFGTGWIQHYIPTISPAPFLTILLNRRKRLIRLRRARLYDTQLKEWIEEFSKDQTPPVFIGTPSIREPIFARLAPRRFHAGFIGWIQRTTAQIIPFIRTWAMWTHRKRRVLLRRAKRWDWSFGWIQSFSQDQLLPIVSTWRRWWWPNKIYPLRRRLYRSFRRVWYKEGQPGGNLYWWILAGIQVPLTQAWHYVRRRADRIDQWRKSDRWRQSWRKRYSTLPATTGIDQVMPKIRTWLKIFQRSKRRLQIRRARLYDRQRAGWILQFTIDQQFPYFHTSAQTAKKKRRIRAKRKINLPFGFALTLQIIVPQGTSPSGYAAWEIVIYLTSGSGE